MIDLNIPLPADAPKPKKVRKGFLVIFCSIVLRILGLAVAAAAIGAGGWTIYQITKDHLDSTGMVQQAVKGAFLCLAGLLALIAETRTRWTMRSCVNTYVIFGSYLARGMYYVILGIICFALQISAPYIQVPSILQFNWVAGGIIGVGGLNLIFYPIYWKYLRLKAVQEQNAPTIANPEEVVYGYTEYVKAAPTAGPTANLPTSSSAPPTMDVVTTVVTTKTVEEVVIDVPPTYLSTGKGPIEIVAPEAVGVPVC